MQLMNQLVFDYSMREIRLRYSAASIHNSDLSVILEVVDRITLVATLYQEDHGEWIRQVYDIVLKEGREIEEINSIPFIELEKHFQSTKVNGTLIHSVMAKNHHPLGKVGNPIEDAVVMPESEVSVQGATLLIRGAPTGVRAMVDGFRKWGEPTRISVVENTTEQIDEVVQLVSPHQANVFITAYDSGYYDTPRGISLVDLSRKMDISRSTVAGHLRTVERIMADMIVERLRDSM